MSLTLHDRILRVRRWMTGNEQPTCATCRYMDPVVAALCNEDGEVLTDDDGDPRLEPAMLCRRRPPDGEWVQVELEDWCGEHRRAR